MKLLLFADYTAVYIENPKESKTKTYRTKWIYQCHRIHRPKHKSKNCKMSRGKGGTYFCELGLDKLL